MAKYIDADALKRWIQAECNPFGAPTLNYTSSVKIMDRIDKMPAADVAPVRRWIQCSEMLPEDGEKVLVYWERLDRKTNTVYGFIDILYRTSERGWYCEGRGELNWNAIAWMPLPPVPVL